ncbi:MAG: hypothetical protein R2711_18075 [Acidimicrobiales bacterium]
MANHNLETSRSYFEVVTTHSFDDRVETCKLVRRRAWFCSGVLLGMGETVDQRLVHRRAGCRRPHRGAGELLKPMAGTPLRPPPGGGRAARGHPLDRPVPSPCPSSSGYAGGREFTLGDLQAMGMTSGINVDHRQLPHLPRALAPGGPQDARRPAHAGRRAQQGAVTASPEAPAFCDGCGRPSAEVPAAAGRTTRRTSAPAAACAWR